jgi:DNA-binding ferritin-like protein
MVKLYHWKTHSFAQHKATDELYSKLNENIDTFMEILLGKDESRVYLPNQRIDLLDYSDVEHFKARIQGYRKYLISMNETFHHRRDSDLLNVRDEILGNINQFIYLLTFNK